LACIHPDSPPRGLAQAKHVCYVVAMPTTTPNGSAPTTPAADTTVNIYTREELERAKRMATSKAKKAEARGAQDVARCYQAMADSIQLG
jgi:hypothetical protein